MRRGIIRFHFRWERIVYIMVAIICILIMIESAGLSSTILGLFLLGILKFMKLMGIH